MMNQSAHLIYQVEKQLLLIQFPNLLMINNVSIYYIA